MPTKPIPMPKPTSCPDFEEHCANRQSAATEYYDISNAEPPGDHKAIEEQLRAQLHSAQKLIHLLHLEIDDRREINELDVEKMWFLGDAIAGCMAKLDDTLMYSDDLQNFLERHRELAMKREEEEARQAKRKARRQAVLEFCGLASFIADVKRKMGKGETLTPDGNDEKDASARDKHDTGKDTSAQEKHDTGKTDTRTDSGVRTSDAPIKPTDNIDVSNKPQPSNSTKLKPTDNIEVSNRQSVFTIADVSRLSIKPQPSDSMKPKPKPLNLKGPVEKPIPHFSGSGGSDEYDIALRIVKKNTARVARQRDVLAQKLDDLMSGLWRVGFRGDLRKRGFFPFTPTR